MPLEGLQVQGFERILAVRLDNVGDVIMLAPALAAIGRACPAARITLMASPAGCEAAPLLASVDDVLTWRAVWQDASAALPLDAGREQALIVELRRRRFDAAFIFTSFSQSAWPPAYACYLASIPVRAGQARDFGGSLLTHRVTPPADCVHQSERNLHLVEALGITPPSRDTALRITRDVESSADRLLREVGITPTSPFVVVAPGASCAARRYEPRRFAEVVRLLADRLRVPHLIVGAARDADVCAEVMSGGLTRARSIAGRTSVPELAAVLRRARLLVGNNSAPMHLADAVRCPMVILYSGTDLEEQWQPRRAQSLVLRRPTPCEPCYRFECPYHMQCLDIAPSDVAAACEELWERTAFRRWRGDGASDSEDVETTARRGAA